MSHNTDSRASDRCIHLLDLAPARSDKLERVILACGLSFRPIVSVDEVERGADLYGLVLMEDGQDELADQRIGNLLDKGQGVILFSQHPRLPRVVDLLTRGAAGYLQWPFDSVEFCQALDTIDGVGRDRLQVLALRARALELIGRLSPREAQVLGLVSSGYRSEDIAVELGISRRTVEGHRINLLAKLEVSPTMTLALGVYAGLDRRSRSGRSATPGSFAADKMTR